MEEKNAHNNVDQKGQAATPEWAKEVIALGDKWIKIEKKKAFWRNLMILSIAVYFIFLSGMAFFGLTLPGIKGGDEKYVSVVHLTGLIAPDADASAEKFVPVMEKALKDENSLGAVLVLNSPGGSPVQSSIINKEITRLKKKYGKPVFAMIEDICTSGCYYVAVAADKIFVDENSIVGSIGVRSDVFGFKPLMDKLGIENRSMYAGKHKAFINPFGDPDEEGRSHFKKHVLKSVHRQFIKIVGDARGDHIPLKHAEQIFSGLVWSGTESIKVGLADDISYLSKVVRDQFKTSNTKVFKVQRSWLEKLSNSKGIGAATSVLIDEVAAAVAAKLTGESAMLSNTPVQALP